MAYFKSIVTAQGAALLTDVMTSGGEVNIVAAAIGTGTPSGEPADMTALVSPVSVGGIILHEKYISQGSPTTLIIPVDVSNLGLTADLPVREIGIFAQGETGRILFAYSWYVGDDGDNVLPVPREAITADAVHTFEVGVFVTNQEAAAVTVTVSDAAYVTAEQLARLTPEDIGAVNLENKGRLFTNYGLIGVNIDEVYDHNYTVGISEEGYGTRPPETGWINVVNFACYHFATQIATTCTIGDIEERPVRMWVRERYTSEESVWSEWKEIVTNGMTTNMLLNVPTNHGFRIKNTATNSATDFVTGHGYSVMRFMDEFDNNQNYRELMLVGTEGAPTANYALRLFDVVDGVQTIYDIYHTGNSPAVVATATAIE